MNTSNPTQYKLPFSLLSTWKTHTRTRTHTLSLSLSLSLFSLFFLSFSLPLTLSLFLSFSLSLSLPLLDKQRQTVERYIQLPQQRKRSKPTVGDTCNVVHAQIQRQNPACHLCTRGVIWISRTFHLHITNFVTILKCGSCSDSTPKSWLLPPQPRSHLNSTNFDSPICCLCTQEVIWILIRTFHLNITNFVTNLIPLCSWCTQRVIQISRTWEIF